MAKIAAALLIGAEATTLNIAWKDCGDAHTHGKITGVHPTQIHTGSAQTVTGTGKVDKDVNGATFLTTLSVAGVQVASCSGDASVDAVCTLPLGTGTITTKAFKFPIKAGTLSVDTVIKLSNAIPPSLAKASSHITALSDTGDKLICMDIDTTKAVTVGDVDCTTSACPTECDCVLDKCADQVDACLADDTCSTGQACALACPCGDTSCALKCVSENPSDLAGPVAQCQFKNCQAATDGAEAATLKIAWKDCGDAHTHGKITGVHPTQIHTGSAQTVTGTGKVDKDVNGATFLTTLSVAGVQVASCSGDASVDAVCTLPLGTGTITTKAFKFPIKAGTLSVDTVIKLSNAIPPSLAKASSHITAKSDTGDKLICMDIDTTKAEMVV